MRTLPMWRSPLGDGAKRPAGLSMETTVAAVVAPDRRRAYKGKVRDSTPASPAAGAEGFTTEQRRILLVSLIVAFLSLLSVSIVNVVLPSIEESLDASSAALQWILSGYALAFGVVLVAAGRAGDIYGRGKIFVAGLVLFGTGSLVAGFAADPVTLNIARVVMGLGSGFINPQVTGLIQQYFAGAQRGRRASRHRRLPLAPSLRMARRRQQPRDLCRCGPPDERCRV